MSRLSSRTKDRKRDTQCHSPKLQKQDASVKIMGSDIINNVNIQIDIIRFLKLITHLCECMGDAYLWRCGSIHSAALCSAHIWRPPLDVWSPFISTNKTWGAKAWFGCLVGSWRKFSGKNMVGCTLEPEETSAVRSSFGRVQFHHSFPYSCIVFVEPKPATHFLLFFSRLMPAL